MRAALEEAKLASARNEVPVGAIIVCDGRIVAKSGNRSIELNDPSAHAEMLAIRAACKVLGAQRIPDCDLYVTLEPCTMCAGAISFARVRRLVYGATDLKGGGVHSGVRFFEKPTCHHRPKEIISGVLKDECAEILKNFFRTRR